MLDPARQQALDAITDAQQAGYDMQSFEGSPSQSLSPQEALSGDSVKAMNPASACRAEYISTATLMQQRLTGGLGVSTRPHSSMSSHTLQGLKTVIPFCEHQCDRERTVLHKSQALCHTTRLVAAVRQCFCGANLTCDSA